MRPAVSALAVAVLVALLASALTPCVESTRPGMESVSAETVHSSHEQDGQQAAAAGHGGCRGARTPPELRAICPCGCADRPTAAGVPTGFGWALLPAVSTLARPAFVRFVSDERLSSHDFPPAPIEHVPLFA